MSRSREVFQELDEPTTREFENCERSLKDNSSKILEAGAMAVLGLLGATTAFQ